MIIYNTYLCVIKMTKIDYDKFPLFQSLLVKCKPGKNGKYKDLSKDEKKFFVEHVRTLNEESHEVIYAIISAFSPDIDTNIPYSGVFINTGVAQFNFNKFPAQLKRILHTFIVMHLSNSDTS